MAKGRKNSSKDHHSTSSSKGAALGVSSSQTSSSVTSGATTPATHSAVTAVVEAPIPSLSSFSSVHLTTPSTSLSTTNATVPPSNATTPSSSTALSPSWSSCSTSLVQRLHRRVGHLLPSSSREFRIKNWILLCVVVGWTIGFVLGSGWLDNVLMMSWWWSSSSSDSSVEESWRQDVADQIRSHPVYQVMTWHGPWWDEYMGRLGEWAADVERRMEVDEYAKNPAHPRVWTLLREAVVREKGGYVHPDLGFLVPAPSGAGRGVGMVRNLYHTCQTQCFPGTAEEKWQVWQDRRAGILLPPPGAHPPSTEEPLYQQEEVLIRVPVTFQMRRSVALDTLLAVIPAEVQRKASLYELDDAALLVLLLAHERGKGRYSRWLPYIASLPTEPSCGYNRALRPHMLDAIQALREEIGVSVEGWAEELIRATQYADKITEGLNKSYGAYLSVINGTTPEENIRWALCQVASRATAGSEKFGALRLIPLVDCINHDIDAGGFIELTGKERIEKGDFVDAREEDGGTFVVRSIRHGRRRPLREGQEILVNYNVPHYSPLDWLVSLGFVPREMWTPWQKIDPVLPRVRRDGPFAEESIPTEQVWKKRQHTLIQKLRETEL